jgi:MFS transporter, DHA2 family, multidrug resistance protein
VSRAYSRTTVLERAAHGFSVRQPGLDQEHAPRRARLRHCLRRVDGQVHDDLLELGAVASYLRQRWCEIDGDGDPFRLQLVMKEDHRVGDHIVQRQCRWPRRAPCCHLPNACDDIRGPTSVVGDALHQIASLRQVRLRSIEPTQCCLTVREHGGKRLVDLVCDRSRKLPQHGNPRRVRELCLQLMQPLLGAHPLRYVDNADQADAKRTHGTKPGRREERIHLSPVKGQESRFFLERRLAADPGFHGASKAAQPRRVITTRPLFGVLAVLLGAVIATLDSRLTTFGLADVRGAVHAGFDGGAWITTAFTVGQMLIGPISVWLGLVFGPRRVLMISGAIFTISNLLLPFSPDLFFVLAFQTVSGLASGTFIPLTIGFVIQNLPPRLVVYGVAAYAMNLELSLNIAASIEGWFSDNWSWKWIFWDTALLAPLMLVCVHFGMPRQATNRALVKTADWWGILYASVGFSLIYAALDQGNRLDWFNSGLINALLLGGTLLLIAFVVHELSHDRPWINLRFAVRGNFPLLIFFIAFFRSVILSTSYIIPLYLTTIQNYRAMEIGGVLMWIALPQFLLAPIVATILRFVDARLTMALGFALVGCACFMAGQLTHDWASDDFLPSQIVQAVGQSLMLTSVLWFNLKHIELSEVLTFGAVLQTARLFGAELGAAFVQTFIRVREQVYSNLIGLHVTTGSQLTDQRLQDYARAVTGRSAGQTEANARATALLARSVQDQANVLAYIDGFMVLGFAVIGALLMMLLLRNPPANPGLPGDTIAHS